MALILVIPLSLRSTCHIWPSSTRNNAYGLLAISTYPLDFQPANILHDDIAIHRLRSNLNGDEGEAELFVSDDEHEVVAGEVRELDVEPAACGWTQF